MNRSVPAAAAFLERCLFGCPLWLCSVRLRIQWPAGAATIAGGGDRFFY